MCGFAYFHNLLMIMPIAWISLEAAPSSNVTKFKALTKIAGWLGRFCRYPAANK